MKGLVGVLSILHALRWKGGWVRCTVHQAFHKEIWKGRLLYLNRFRFFPWKGRWMCCPCTLSTKTHEAAGGCSLPTSDFQTERQVGMPSGFPQTSIEGQVGVFSLHQTIHKGRWEAGSCTSPKSGLYMERQIGVLSLHTLNKEIWKGRRVCSPYLKHSDGRADGMTSRLSTNTYVKAGVSALAYSDFQMEGQVGLLLALGY